MIGTPLRAVNVNAGLTGAAVGRLIEARSQVNRLFRGILGKKCANEVDWSIQLVGAVL